MSEQDRAVFDRESGPVSAETGPFQREDYSDAHFEQAEESTVPPRYYTPHERSARTGRVNNSGSGAKNGIICAVLGAAVLGSICGTAVTSTRLNSRMEMLENSLTAVESTLREIKESQAGENTVNASLTYTNSASEMRPADIYEQAKHQVVGIRTEITRTNYFGITSSGAVSGSGFIITDDGYILTNYHVVEEAHIRNLNIEVITYDGSMYGASIVGVESDNDIAVLKIEAEGLTATTLGDSDLLLVGDTVYAVGNPLGELEFSMSTGHVSALDRVINTQENEEINMFQIDAAVNEGNSGGPVYDSDGRVVGIVTAKYSSSGVEGLGFAIPINDAKSIADDLITKGYVTGKAFMGVSLDNRYNSMYSQYYGMPMGAYVSEVTSGSAAERAGLRSGDIITAIGSYSVSEYSELKTAMRHFSAYDETEITVYRAGGELRLPIKFDEAGPQQ